MINFLQNRSSEKGAITPMAAFFITAVAAIFLLAYWMQGYPRTAVPTNSPVACSQEVKLCPDGSAVGRVGPNCEFAKCPQQNIDTSNWKTYWNEKYGFEVKYPIGWEIEETSLYPFNFTIHHISNTSKLIIGPIGVGQESVFDKVGRKYVNLEPANFAGIKAEQYICPGKNKCPSQLAHSRAIHLVNPPKGWEQSNEIYYDIENEYRNDYPIAEQILSTFRFTN